MKKITVILSVLLLALCLAFAAGAEDYVRIEEGDIVVPVPEDYDVITRNIEDDDPVLKKYGFTKEQVVSLYENSHIYLEMIDQSRRDSFVLTIVDSDVEELGKLSDIEVETLLSASAKSFQSYGMTVDESSVYENDDGVKYLKFVIHDATGVNKVQYSAISKGKILNFTFSSMTGADLDEDQLLLAEDIVDYTVFNVSSMAGGAPMPFTFTDDDTDLRFSVPEGWASGDKDTYESDFGEAPFDSFDAFFSRYPGYNDEIFFSSDYEWDEMPQEFRDYFGNDRSKMNDKDLSKRLASQWIGAEESEFKQVSYGGVNYLKAERELDEGEKTIALVTYRNGYIYTYYYYGPSDSDVFSEFEQILKTAVYPKIEEAAPVETDSPDETDAPETKAETEPAETTPVDGTADTEAGKAGEEDKDGDSASKKKDDKTLIIIIAASAVGAALIALILILVFKKKKKNKQQQQIPVQPQNFGGYAQPFVPQQPQQGQPPFYAPTGPQQFNAPAAPQPAAPEAPRQAAPEQPAAPSVCPNCGNPIPQGTKFCPHCGNKI